MGFRKIELMNKAFIMKLAWGLLKDNSMSSNRGEGRPVATSRDFLLWKSICREWDVVHENISWNLGNGRQETQIESLNYTVAEMVDGRGNWKWEVFAHLLTVQTVMGIAGYIPPRQDALEDSVVWDLSANGSFNVKTAYLVREEGETMDQDPIWRIVWKWKRME
uniref:Reverse transcriptase zinc-binding domain-containing protein n=1 Tax=Salix viminalis TaxID=40686 RepID=A0A6N2NKD1_SALVM